MSWSCSRFSSGVWLVQPWSWRRHLIAWILIKSISNCGSTIRPEVIVRRFIRRPLFSRGNICPSLGLLPLCLCCSSAARTFRTWMSTVAIAWIILCLGRRLFGSSRLFSIGIKESLCNNTLYMIIRSSLLRFENLRLSCLMQPKGICKGCFDILLQRPLSLDKAFNYSCRNPWNRYSTGKISLFSLSILQFTSIFPHKLYYRLYCSKFY